ncbi:SsrA-binding protein SmpB [Bradymonas sediminis]|uniref:SsrA-binding protein n=1 Tax=Bradymonas sediminis TaxID=1548548 RepID=A0A2Z4FIJ8_9DELT|nr:SsrA-binding protein SmpB [Bradymonas sediminis]AWV88554.1 SsrA-binding protein [Bradymonas sediminis]TDP77694.1 SsrA-binding protein [Bradymonas sediminis]
MADEKIKIITRNRKARHNYYVDQEFEAGVKLLGSEVKSLRDGKVQLKDAYARFENHELFLHKVHIAPYPQATHENHEAERDRKLLMHRRELNRLEHQLNVSGTTLIPLALYFKGGNVKVELGLCRGKKLFDKRHDLKKSQAKREMARAAARHNEG